MVVSYKVIWKLDTVKVQSVITIIEVLSNLLNSAGEPMLTGPGISHDPQTVNGEKEVTGYDQIMLFFHAMLSRSEAAAWLVVDSQGKFCRVSR